MQSTPYTFFASKNSLRYLNACLTAALLSFCLSAGLQRAVAQQPNSQSPLGLNLSGPVAWEFDWTFVNVAHHSLAWFPIDQEPLWGQWYSADDLTADAYLPAGTDGILCIIWDAPQAITQDFVIEWQGEAEVRPLAHWSSPTLLNSSDNQISVRLENETFFFLEVRNNSLASPLNNLVCKRIEHAALEQTFTPEFINFVAEFKSLRFMDWMGTNSSEVVRMQDYTPDGALIQRPVAFAYMLELVNLVQADPWFCVPLQADDQFVTEMAQRIVNELDPNLTVRIELSNEVWNGIFAQHRQAAERARSLNLSTSANDWEAAPVYYGYRSAQVHNLVDQVFGLADAPHNTCPLIAWQSVNSWFVNRDVVPSYRAERINGAAPRAMALAPYVGGSLGSPDRQTQIAGWTLDQLFNQLLNGAVYPDDGNVAATMQHVITYRDQLDDWGISDLICYEAGQHLVGHGGAENNQMLTDLFIAANRDARMQTVYAQYLNAWRDVGGGLMMMFASHGRPSKWGSWGMREHIAQPAAEAPKYRACHEFIGSNPVSWNACDFSWENPSTAVAAAELTEQGFVNLRFADDILVVDSQFSGRCDVFDFMGRMIYSRSLQPGVQQINTTSWPPGIYVFRFDSSAQRLHHWIVIVS